MHKNDLHIHTEKKGALETTHHRHGIICSRIGTGRGKYDEETIRTQRKINLRNGTVIFPRNFKNNLRTDLKSKKQYFLTRHGLKKINSSNFTSLL